MEFAVIIPAYKTPPLALKRCLDSVLSQTATAELIVVDSSSASLAPELAIYKDKVRFFFPGKRMFAGEARNFGAALTQKEILIFLDSDCLWNPGWLEAAKNATIKYPQWRALCGQIHFEDPSQSFAYALHLLEFHEFLSKRDHELRFLHSGNLVIRANFFKDVGGFKSDWAACEDIGFLAKNSSPSDFRFIPELSITHTSHLTEKSEVLKKIQFMGYWRGFYDSKLPRPFQISAKKYFWLLRPALGFTFWMIILKRNLLLGSTKLCDTLRHSLIILKLANLWAKAFNEGLKKPRKIL